MIALYRPVLLAYFSRAPSDSELEIVRAIVREARAEKERGGMLFVAARRNAAGGIQPRVRKFFEEMVRENSAHFGASAVVVLMEGFGGSLMRSFLTGLVLLSSKGKQFRVFQAVDAACQWLAPRHNLDAATLLQVYEQSTAKIERRA